jgi:hypothetical protein
LFALLPSTPATVRRPEPDHAPEFACGHVALVSVRRLKGESATARNERIRGEKLAAQAQAW